MHFCTFELSFAVDFLTLIDVTNEGSVEVGEPTLRDFAGGQKVFGRYTLAKILGRGGMGIVWLARDEELERNVALKFLPDLMIQDRAVIDQLRRETKRSLELTHPHIVRIYDFVHDERAGCISMEYVDGETLAGLRCQKEQKVFEPSELSAWVGQLCEALDYAHNRAHIIHCDLKPANLMVNQHGDLKVSDFGIARSMSDSLSMLTREQGRSGTLVYMSPQQLAGERGTHLDDIYSLGATLYDLLTSKPPFYSGNIDRQIHERVAPSMTERRKELDIEPALVPAVWEEVVAACLAKDPARRPQSTAEVARRLQLSPPQTLTVSAISGKRPKKVMLWTGLVAICLIAIAGWYFGISRRQAPNPPPPPPPQASVIPEKSIAVLPFLDLSQTKDQEYFCDGMSEEILDALAKIEGLRVVARTSSFSFKGKSVDVNEVGKKLNVANVLEGSLRREGNRSRITAQLVNARNGFQLWSETYERELQGVFALQDEITRAIVEALKIKLAISLPAHEQRNTEAYDLYLQGLYFSNKGSEEDLRKALGFFQRALDKDPKFSRAWTGIAKVWFFLADVYVKPLEAYPASKAAALKAIELDEKDAEAHCYLGEAKRVLDWDLAGEDAELKRALVLDPNSAPAHFFSALLPLFRGEVKEGLRLVLEAEKLDPLSPITSYVATAAYLANDRIDDAVLEGQRTLQLDPNYFYLDSNLAAAYREKGNFAEAIALYMRAQDATHFPSSGLAITYARMGRQNEARKILDQLVQERGTRYVSAHSIAAVYVAFGEKEEAFRWLERASSEHSGILQWIAFLPEFRALHPDARFPQLLRRIGVSHDSILAITETTLSEIPDPNVQTRFNLKIGVKPRPNTENGHVVRISVSFYDLTKDNKMKPTDARTGYNWLTPARDWTDATPKFLAATYLRPKTEIASSDGRRYGGFIVRVYFDGQLQDSRATPPELLTLFPSEDQPVSSPNAAPSPLH
jgi:serine/threonine protein kinase